MTPMLLTREPPTTFVPLHPAEGCVEFPLLLQDEELAELDQQARSAQRTIGQMIRQALGLYLAGVRDRCDAGGGGDSQPDTPSDGPGVLAVTLLLPVSRLLELEAIAARGGTTAGALIRRVVWFSLHLRSPHQQPPNDS